VTPGVADLLAEYRTGRLRPAEVASTVLETIAEDDAPAWITLVPEDRLVQTARALEAADPALPLYAIPFAVKDNIDVAGLPTTAACPGSTTTPDAHAPVVRRLLDAGALLVGKTNMDQFATGLVGTRTPYGVGSSVFDPARVSGGSSSGSALAVARGHVAFALGTDTAGSGRVPAAFNGLVGLKPTRGLLSTCGVLPACASVDCVSILTTSVADAAAVFDVAAAYDPGDPWSRHVRPYMAPRRDRVGVPKAGQAVPEEAAAERAWAEILEAASEIWRVEEVDISALLEASPLLYGAWLAERSVDLGETIAARPEGLDPVVAGIVAQGTARRGTDVFAAIHRLADLRREAAAIWESVDALMLPTTLSHPTHAQVAADPVGVNAGLGRLTSFVNLMDLAALAVPGRIRDDGRPFGVTLLAPAFADHRLLELAARWTDEPVDVPSPGAVRLAVAGAHMSGLPLNGRLTDLGARLVGTRLTSPCYRLYELPDAAVRRPGLVRVSEGGTGIEVEVWELASSALGVLLLEMPAPLSLGRVQLSNNAEVIGFLCEGHAAAGCADITEHGGWRTYLNDPNGEVRV
jgi:allophanate hydrolase